MHPEISKLATLLDEASALLRTYREDHWAEWLEKDARWIRNLDLHGIEHFLSACGGMGSIGDVYICPENGHPIEPKDVERINDKLRGLLSEIFRLAEKLRREELAAGRKT
jgi:hypothetical protein